MSWIVFAVLIPLFTFFGFLIGVVYMEDKHGKQ